MSNEEMFQTILNRMDSMESSLNGKMDKLDHRMDKLDDRMDKLDDRMDKLDDRMDKLDGRMAKLDGRMDTMENGLNGLSGRMDTMENDLNGLNVRIDKLESSLDLEFFAVRKEMDAMNKSIQEQINILDNKIDRLMFTKDVEGYDKINIRLEVLESGYQELKEKIV